MVLDCWTVKTVSLPTDHAFCSPDVTLQSYEGSNQSTLQTVVISKEDQNIIVETIQYKSSKLEEAARTSRKTKIQDFSAKFPIFAYNIGTKKLVF